VFESEVRAYKIAMKSPKLHTLVPEFFGIRPTQIILDNYKKDISDEFIPCLAFEATLIDDNFVKLGAVCVCDVERQRITKLFASEGIKYLKDASVLLQGKCVVKVIDFAVKEFELNHP